MGKKKQAAGRKVAKKAAKKKTTKKAAKKAASAAKTAARKKTTKSSTKKKLPAKKSSTKKSTKSRSGSAAKSQGVKLGRPKVTGEEKLFMLFHDDYYARQVFDFLRVQTVKELEEYSPEEIIRLLSKPIRESVDHIRRRLAEKNRALKGDEEFVGRVKAAKSADF